MTMSKQAQKTLSENTEKTFFRKYAPLFIEGGGIITEITVLCKKNHVLENAIIGIILSIKLSVLEPPLIVVRC